MTKLPLWIRRFPIRVVVVLRIITLELRSFSRSRFKWNPDSIPVSIATYGRREKWIHLTIESIYRGSVNPSAIFVWLDKPSGRALPNSLRRLAKQGVRLSYLDSSHRSHKKWVGPAQFLDQEFSRGVVLADDDFIYPRNWLGQLLASAQKSSSFIHAWRCKAIRVVDDEVQPYEEWGLGRFSSEPSFLNFATTGAGTYVPFELLRLLKPEVEEQKHILSAPTADDIWLHSRATALGFRTVCISPDYLDWPQNPLQGVSGLADANVGRGGNNLAISSTYTIDQVKKLAAEG